MIAYFWWALAVIVIAATIALVTYATKAGRNAQSVQTSLHTAENAVIVTNIQSKMAEAQAKGPQDKAQLLARLDKGAG